MNLIRDVLDSQLCDRNGRNIGRVDGIVVDYEPGRQPRVVALESGYRTLFRRLGPRVQRLADWIIQRLPFPVSPVTRFPWERVSRLELDIHLDIDENASDSQLLERWLRDHVVAHIPGSRHE